MRGGKNNGIRSKSGMLSLDPRRAATMEGGPTVASIEGAPKGTLTIAAGCVKPFPRRRVDEVATAEQSFIGYEVQLWQTPRGKSRRLTKERATASPRARGGAWAGLATAENRLLIIALRANWILALLASELVITTNPAAHTYYVAVRIQIR
jgi:hypothetical protein